jgi:hypothetical protein
MATTINQISSPAQRGQSVQVYLNSAETLAKLSAVTVGQKAVITSSSKVGYVCSVDSRGNSYEVTPETPASRFDSTTTPGILNATEVITLT